MFCTTALPFNELAYTVRLLLPYTTSLCAMDFEQLMPSNLTCHVDH